MRLTLTSRTRHAAAVLALAGGTAILPGCAPALTTTQEVQAGADYARQINAQLPMVNDAATVRFVNDLGRQIARNADPRGIQYNFYVVNSDVVNAFAIPGGHVYVNRGLIERTENMSELAGVLAHEIGHVVERHGIEQVQRAQNTNTGLALLYGVLLGRNPSTLEQAGIQVGGTAVFASYSRDAEREADAVAVPYLIASGINPQGLVTMFQKLLSDRQRAPGRVEQWFSTHPLTQERVANIQAQLNATPAARGANLTTNTAAYRSFQTRLRGLSPQPSDRQ